jgi:flagellar protein FlbD
MVRLTRMTGAQFALNPDLIERVDSTPDTVIALVDGTRYLVSETLDEVVAAVVGFRARVLHAAGGLEVGVRETRAERTSRLTAVPESTDGVAPTTRAR